MRKYVQLLFMSVAPCCLFMVKNRCCAFYTARLLSDPTRPRSPRCAERSMVLRTTAPRHRPSRTSVISTMSKGQEGGEVNRKANGVSSDRRGFVRSAGQALLSGTGAVATIFGVTGRCPAGWGVGLQPGERETAPPPPLLLIPALRAKLAVQNMCQLLEDPKRWDEVAAALSAPPLAAGDFKACFRTYSDADPEQHLQFDLYRIQAQDALKAVSELLAYLAFEKKKGSEILPDDVKDLRDAGRSVLQGIDDFLQLAPREDVIMVERNTRAAAAVAATSAVAPLATENAGRGRTLRGAVAGEGAFVGGAWMRAGQ